MSDAAEWTPPKMSDGTPFRPGQVVRHKTDGTVGVVDEIGRNGVRPNRVFLFDTDLSIKLGAGHYRITNCHDEWELVPRAEQTHVQRAESWLFTPAEEGEDVDDPLEATLALLPVDPRDEDMFDWPDGWDGLIQLAEHCDAMQARIVELTAALRLADEIVSNCAVTRDRIAFLLDEVRPIVAKALGGES